MVAEFDQSLDELVRVKEHEFVIQLEWDTVV